MKKLESTIKEIKTYLYMRKKVNERMLESALKKELNYNSKTQIHRTRVIKYLFGIYRVPGIPTQWKILDKIYVPEKYKSYWEKLDWAHTLRINNITYHLVTKTRLPWWLLGEFGGPVKDIPDDFLNYLKAANV